MPNDYHGDTVVFTGVETLSYSPRRKEEHHPLVVLRGAETPRLCGG